MGASGNSIALKSFQSFAISDGLLAKVVEAVKAGEKEARTSGVQSFEVFYKGFRQNIAIGRIYIVPASVCSDRQNFPIALLYGTAVRELNLGEEVADLISKKIGDSEFDEYSQADFQTLKDTFFKNEDGKYTSLVIFAPSWSNVRDYVYFKYTDDDKKLENLLRHQVFSCYFDPALSSAFDALMTNVDTTKWDVTDVTPKLQYPSLLQGEKQYPELMKTASNRKKAFLTAKNADELTQAELDPQELNVFESLDTALSNAMMPETETPQEAAGDFKAPGEVTTEGEGDRNDPRLGEDGSYTEVMNGENQKSAAIVPNETFQCQDCGHEGALSTHGKCATCGSDAVVSTHKLGKWASFSGKCLKTASVKMTFGNDKVYFEMNGNKYMLEGADAEQFIDEWLPIYQQLKAKAEAERGKVVDQLVQKYMDRMKKRTAPAKKAPVVSNEPVPAPEAESPVEEPVMAASQKEAGFWDAVKGPDMNAVEPFAQVLTQIENGDCGEATLAKADELASKTRYVKEWKAIREALKYRQADPERVDALIVSLRRAVMNMKRRYTQASLKKKAMDAFVAEYIRAALWSSTDESNEQGGDPMDSNYSVQDIAPETIKQMEADCAKFRQQNAESIAQANEAGVDDAHIAHDFWLTRNRHGAGFWDGDYPDEIGTALTDAAHQFGEFDLYIGDDGKIYGSGGYNNTTVASTDDEAATMVAGLLTEDFTDDYNASSTKHAKSASKNEQTLDKFRKRAGLKVADVPLTEESIWNELTEDFGEAPQVELPGEHAGQPFGPETKAPNFESKTPKTEEPKAEEPKQEQSYDEPKREEPKPETEHKAPEASKQEPPKTEEKKEDKPEEKPVEKSEENEEKSKEASEVNGDLSEAHAEVEATPADFGTAQPTEEIEKFADETDPAWREWVPNDDNTPSLDADDDGVEEMVRATLANAGPEDAQDIEDALKLLPHARHAAIVREFFGEELADPCDYCEGTKEASAGDEADEEVPVGNVDVLASLTEEN